MFRSNTLLSLILVTLIVTAVDAVSINRRTGKATLSFSTKINGLGDLNIAQKDLARAQALKQGGRLTKRSGSNVDVTNAATNYVAQVGVGSPPTDYTLLIDTGSSNTWVGASKAYVPTGTSEPTGAQVSVSYGSGNFSGKEYLDTVTLSPDLVIDKQSIGVADSSEGISGVDGILGVGPTDLTSGTLNTGNTAIPTVLDNLLSQEKISQEVLGIYFEPVSDSKGGELTFGGVDESATVGPVIYVPLTTTSPASEFWGIDQSIKYGDNTLLSSTAGIVDTGTTLILIASDAFEKYQSLTGGVKDTATGLLKITPSQYDALELLEFNVGDVPFFLTPNAQIWPRSLNTDIGGTSDSIYLVVSDIGTPSGSGLDFISGYTFLERFYSVYDTTNARVGLAYTTHTLSTNN